MEIPVYLFSGFLDSGKTKFINESLKDERFNSGEKTLILLCEQGEEEYTPDAFSGKNVNVEIIDSPEKITSDRLVARLKRYGAERVIIEYNGMWSLAPLFDALPDDWMIYQHMYLADANTIMVFNSNMRNLVAENLQNCDVCVFNRLTQETDKMPLHKLVRALNRRTEIIYEQTDGTTDYDEIEDPLPFDINAPVIEIEDRDYALFYRDLMEDMNKYNGKTVKFKGIIAKNSQIPRGTFVAGRHVMTCCVQDITYSALACDTPDSDKFKNGSWAVITGQLEIAKHFIYSKEGPVIKVTSTLPCDAPEEKVATFY